MSINIGVMALLLASSSVSLLTHFMPLVSLYTPWKHQKTSGFLIFLGGIEREHWQHISYQERLYLTLNKSACWKFYFSKVYFAQEDSYTLPIPPFHFKATVLQTSSESYSGFCETSKMELFAKSSIFYIWGNSEYASTSNDPTGF